MKRFLYKLLHPLVRFYWRVFKPKTFGCGAIILNDNEILLVKNINVSRWSLPTGGMGSRENPEQCIIREMKEELDLNISETDFKLGQYTSNKQGKVDTISIFIIKVQSKYFKKQWELEDASWFSLDNLPKDISPAGLKRIRELQDGKKGVVGGW